MGHRLLQVRADNQGERAPDLCPAGGAHNALPPVPGDAGLYLVSVGARVDSLNNGGESPLHVASSHGLATLATALIVAGADPNIQTNSYGREIWRQTPLHLALEAGQEAVVTCLLEFSQPSPGLDTKLLDLNIKNSADETPLAVALGKGFTLLAKQMIQSGSDVNVSDGSGMSLLLKAIRDNNLAAASFLLSNGADINTRSPQGMTPLELAVREGAETIVEKLFMILFRLSSHQPFPFL